jgi:hypothetical protein
MWGKESVKATHYCHIRQKKIVTGCECLYGGVDTKLRCNALIGGKGGVNHILLPYKADFFLF